MNVVGMLPDIPKPYTALAEWLSCVVYIFLCLRRVPGIREIMTLGGALAALLVLQWGIGIGPVAIWLPGMALALAVMFLTIRTCCGCSSITGAYWLMRAFLLAEFVASLDWQLFYYLSERYGWRGDMRIQTVMLVVVYAAVFAIAIILELRSDLTTPEVTRGELAVSMIIAAVTFSLSNLSYVATSTPFSSGIGTEVFNIRTLVGLGGVAFLYAFHIQLCENHSRKELDAIRSILRMQYAQYQQSKESIAVINHKYHDLKNQIAVLRRESNPDRREEYLDDIEHGIKEYEAQFKTGNAVIDTILTGKGLVCARDGIELTCVADGTLLNRVSEMDTCTIFGNALDNAIEYERTLPDEGRRLVHVSVSQASGFALVRVGNYLRPRERVPLRGGLPVSTKGDDRYHGFGLKSVRQTVEKYGGTLTVGVTDGWFELKVLIPLP